MHAPPNSEFFQFSNEVRVTSCLENVPRKYEPQRGRMAARNRRRWQALLILVHGTLANCFVRASHTAKPPPTVLRSERDGGACRRLPVRMMRPSVFMTSERKTGTDAPVLESGSLAGNLVTGNLVEIPSSAVEQRVSPTDEEISNLAKIFEVYDTSGDGSIDLEEMQAALARAGKPVSRERAAEILEELDEDGDGEISLDELLRAFQLEETGEGPAASPKCPIVSAAARLLHLLRARLVYLCSSALPG